MADIGSLIVNITSTTKGLQAGIHDAEQRVGKASKTLRVLGKAAGAAAIGGLAVFAGGTVAAAATLPKLISMGSDAEEMMGKFTTVFGEYSEGVIADLNGMAGKMGRSKFEMREFAASFQDTFVPLGFAREKGAELSDQLVELTYDVASFNNTMEADTARDFQSALVGNHETVRKYGIVITQAGLNQELLNMGVADGVKGATEQEKVMARLNMIMAGTTDAQGDAVRTAGSWANQMRALKSTISDTATEIGLKLLPVVTPVLSKFRELAQEWGPKVASFFSERLLPAVFDIGEGLGIVKQMITEGWDDIGPGPLVEKFGLLGQLIADAVIGYQEGGVGYAMELIGTHLMEAWNTKVHPVISTWPGKFWTWLTEPETGVLARATTELDALITSITAWSTNSSGKFKNIGSDIGDFIVDGVVALLGGEKTEDAAAKSTIRAFLGSLGRALLTLDAEIARAGAQIGIGIAGEIAEAVAGEEAKTLITDELNEMLEQIALDLAFGPFGPLIRASGIIPGYGLQGYATGGTVRGPIGAPQLAIVHGGETVTPAGESPSGANVTLHFNFGGGFSRQEANAAAALTVDALRTHGVAI